jgi:hypothetical protein
MPFKNSVSEVTHNPHCLIVLDAVQGCGGGAGKGLKGWPQPGTPPRLHKSGETIQREAAGCAKHIAERILCGLLQPVANSILKLLVHGHEAGALGPNSERIDL